MSIIIRFEDRLGARTWQLYPTLMHVEKTPFFRYAGTEDMDVEVSRQG